MSLIEKWNAFFNKTVPNMVLRLIVMTFGLVLVGFAVALARATGLGTSPISCIPATLSFLTPISIGTWTFILNMLFILTQMVLLKKDFHPVQFLQVPFVLALSVIIDVCVPFCDLIPFDAYWQCILGILVACICTSFGIFLQVRASILLLPGDGIVLAVTKVTSLPFPRIKIIFDTSNVVIAVAISLAVAGGLFGVREGTVFTALFTGVFIGFWNKAFPHFETFCPVKGHISFTAQPETAEEAAATIAEDDIEKAQIASGKAPLVITISRQYGSGGRHIGRAVGKTLGIPVYDEALITLTAKESGLTDTYVKEHGESVHRGILYSLYMQNYEYIGKLPAETDLLFIAQARTITKLADKESCVIVGRCANAILANRPHVFNVFVHAPLENRIARVMRRDHVSRQEALFSIERIDRERADHMRTYTGETWGDIDLYDLSVDSSKYSEDVISRVICYLATKSK